MAMVLTSCTNRKRVPAPRELTASSVRPGSLEKVAEEWIGRLARADGAAAASHLYCGRAFRQAEAAAAHLTAEFWVVSAGLGVVSADTIVPSYSLTVVPGTPDSIVGRIAGGATPAEWWQALCAYSLFGASLSCRIKSTRGPLLIALSGPYLAMIGQDLLALPEKTRSRLRIFTLASRASLPQDLSKYVMPYDARFDGAGSPMPGTRGDFAQRALAHFVESVLSDNPKGMFEEHADAVGQMMSKLRPPKAISRTKASDDEILALIHRHWSKLNGQSSRMLRYLRDDLQVACEQSRFRDLFRAARDART